MCQESFKKVGELLGDAVDVHGGVLVATPGEIKEHLYKELGNSVVSSAIEHFALALRKRGLESAPHPDAPLGGVVVIRDTTKYPSPQDGYRKGKKRTCIFPEARLFLSERRALTKLST